MFKKVIAVITIGMLLFSSSAYASEAKCYLPNENIEQKRFVITPLFIGVNNVSATFGISSGTAQCKVKVTPQTPTSIDYTMTTATITSANGSEIKEWSNIKSTMSGMYFTFAKSYSLTKRGSYRMEYTVKFYKNNKVIDQHSGETSYKVY